MNAVKRKGLNLGVPKQKLKLTLEESICLELVGIVEKTLKKKKLMEAGWAFSTRKPFTVQGCPANIRILRPGSLCASPSSTVTTTDSPRPCFRVGSIN